ncbi:NADAR family protein [Pirellulaceae bacterium SH501]
MPEVINFYYIGEKYGEFSNFASFPIELDGKIWPSSEHYFQAQKFVGTEHEEAIRSEESPMKAAKMGRERNRPLRSDWEAVKNDIMRRAIHAKFTQHEQLRHLLINTGDAVLVEHTKNDSYWGDGGDGTGMNMLGQMLMETRDQLRNDA